jgi:hypothetical protein
VKGSSLRSGRSTDLDRTVAVRGAQGITALEVRRVHFGLGS